MEEEPGGDENEPHGVAQLKDETGLGCKCSMECKQLQHLMQTMLVGKVIHHIQEDDANKEKGHQIISANDSLGI